MYVDMADEAHKSKIKLQIDENLKRIYDQTSQEKIPDRLTLLLQQLRDKGQRDSPVVPAPTDQTDGNA